jgi:dipeptidyl aminopeptidase/acylaminoacyl peptidase
VSPDSSYVVGALQFRSEGFLINGWLYLPMEGRPSPLVVLTNGGGNDERAIKSLSNFLAPRLAYCGVAAFVHDKRGTGASEGVFRDTDYEDYITDTGNAALLLSKDPRIDPSRIGVMGGSEGGRIAVVAAARYPIFDFVISLMGPAISMVEDRYLAETNGVRNRVPGMEDYGGTDAIWRALIEAYASADPHAVSRMDARIERARGRIPRQALPFTSSQAASSGYADQFVPSWSSLKYDYVTEMEAFRKPWLAIFGEEDPIVPPEPNVQEIHRTSALSGNPDVSVLLYPRMGHAPVDSETGRRVLFENPILNWMLELELLSPQRRHHGS